MGGLVVDLNFSKRYAFFCGKGVHNLFENVFFSKIFVCYFDRLFGCYFWQDGSSSNKLLQFLKKFFSNAFCIETGLAKV